MAPELPAPTTRPGSLLRRIRWWSTRFLSFALVVLLVGAAIGGFVVTRRAVSEQNHRVLVERAATIEASLISSEQNLVASLQVLGDIATSGERDALVVFNRVAADQLVTASGVGAARLVGNRLVVVAGAGTVKPGATLTAEQSRVARRAQSLRTFVAAMLPNPPRILLTLAVHDVVVFQESSLAPAASASTTTPTASPFGDLDIALYASSRPDNLVFATKATPFQGVQVTRRVTVGADTWTLLVASKRPLVGTFTERVPWIILGAGLLAAGLSLLVVGTLVKRRQYALRLVAERTAALEEAKQFQESLLLSGPVMVTRSRLPDLALTYVSPNVERILGIKQEEGLPGDGTAAEQIHPDDLPALRAAIARVTEGTVASETLEVRVQVAPDAYRWISDVIIADRDATGAITGMLTYVTDVDDRKTAELALRAAQESAESANRAKSEFLSRMSHELRTPMNAVLGFGQLLERDPLTPDQRESVGYILKAGRHLLGLIDEILDISRIEAGTMNMSPEPVRADRVLDETLDLIRPLAEARGIRLVHANGLPSPAYVLADHQRLKQILLNLLSNAVKYNVPGGTVTASVAAPSSASFRINVTDTGPGISADQRNLLFTPFQRLGAEHGPVEGTGIGLVLSRHLAEAMGGRLDMDSVPGEGSTFWVQLPRAEGQVDRLDRLDGNRTDGERPMPATRRKRVLQIEDNTSNSRLMERLLESRPEVELIVAALGRLGLDLAREHQPHLILLDLHLPDVSGEEVLHELREDPVTAGIPVVVVSADGTHGQAGRLKNAGASAYLTKPFDVNELLTLIDDTLAVR